MVDSKDGQRVMIRECRLQRGDATVRIAAWTDWWKLNCETDRLLIAQTRISLLHMKSLSLTRLLFANIRQW